MSRGPGGPHDVDLNVNASRPLQRGHPGPPRQGEDFT
jgi:hypothetical protein